MIRLNERKGAAAGSLLFGLFIMFIYLFKHAVILTDIYLGSDRTTHVKIVFISGILGLICFLLSKKLDRFKWLRFTGYGFSIFLSILLPLLIFINQSGSFRGVEWALETLLIGLAPLLFLYTSVFIFLGNRILSLLLSLVLSAFSGYHLLLLFKAVRSVGRAFSTTGSSDIWFMLILILSSAFFAFISFKNYIKSGTGIS